MLLHEKFYVCSESTHAWMHENGCGVLKLFFQSDYRDSNSSNITSRLAP